MRQSTSPGPTWLLGVVIVALLAGGVAQVVAERTEPVVTTTVTEHEVLPDDQAEVGGTITSFVAVDAVGAPLAMPLELETGTATIEGATVDGDRSTIVWDGGRPFRLSGTGALDLGPTRVELGGGDGAVTWHIDGLRILSAGDYHLDTPVAVGTGGLARPADAVDLVAGDETTIETPSGTAVVRGLPVHLEGPGTFEAEGRFTIRTSDGTVEATRLTFGPGPFVVDVADGGAFTGVFNGVLTSG
jgi:hypothetical protein